MSLGMGQGHTALKLGVLYPFSVFASVSRAEVMEGIQVLLMSFCLPIIGFITSISTYVSW